MSLDENGTAPIEDAATPEPSGHDAAVAALQEQLGAEESPDPVTAASAGGVEVPPAEVRSSPPQGEAIALPNMDKLRELEVVARQRLAEREAREAPLKAMQAQLDEKFARIPTGPSIALSDLATPDLAIAALQAAGVDVGGISQQHNKSLLAPDQGAMMKDALTSAIAPLLEQLQQQTKPAADAPKSPAVQAQELDEAKALYGDYIGGAGASLYPEQARLPNELRGTIAFHYVERMRSIGVDTTQFTNDQIATAVEASLKPPALATNGAESSPAANGSREQPPAVNDGPTSSATRSITNGLAADGSRRAPTTPKECFADAVAYAESVIRAN